MDEQVLLRELSVAGARPKARVHARDNTPCTAVNLPEGTIIMPSGETVKIPQEAAFRPSCDLVGPPAIIASGGGPASISHGEVSDLSDPGRGQPQFSDFRDPFHASTFPQCYALAATTIMAYTLVIMLFITPRSFLDGGVVVLGKGFTNGGTGASIGARPWLQKVAALTVAISMTIASADTFRVAEQQYSWGIQNAQTMQQEVLGGTELKVIRIISDTFLWLAQAQSLIRLFPRHREKVIIKWTAFALITLDLIFQSLNSFQYTNQGQTRPRNFTDAVPALSYLFQLALGVLYAAWVIYYSLMKKRYAYYHRQMKNMVLVAALSLVAILVPVVFFILDISKPDFTAWGDYVRWVGAAAASVVVWEWVERIEALEREEKKDGVLGREIFDGDEMMDFAPSEFAWPRRRKTKGRDESDEDDETGRSRGNNDPAEGVDGRKPWPTLPSIAARYRSRSRPAAAKGAASNSTTALAKTHGRTRFLAPPLWPSRPTPALTPVSRTDSISAASTVYAVRYHPLAETTTRPTPLPVQESEPLSQSNSSATRLRSTNPTEFTEPDSANQSTSDTSLWIRVRMRNIMRGLSLSRNKADDAEAQSSRGKHEESVWDFRSRLEDFAVSQAEKIRERLKPTLNTDSLPVTVIPAPPRPGAALAHLQEVEAEAAAVLSRSRNGDTGIMSPIMSVHPRIFVGSESGPSSPGGWRVS